MMNNNEQTEEYEDIFYRFTLEEGKQKNKQTKNKTKKKSKKKDNFGFGIFSYRETILEFLILYIRNIITLTFE